MALTQIKFAPGVDKQDTSVGAVGRWTDSDNVKDAISEAKSDAVALPRFSIIANHNGTLGNGQLVGYSNLLNKFLVNFRDILTHF